MADKKYEQVDRSDENVVARAKDTWARNQKPILIVTIAVILLAGGYLGYKYFILAPKEEKAQDVLFRAEEYFRMDSIDKALKGDNLNYGFLKVIDKYGGTKAGNLARFYAGVCLVRTGDFKNAIKHLKEFKTSNKQTQTRAYKLIGDAYAELGQNDDAISSYKKAAAHFPEDELNACEALYFAAGLSEKTGKKQQAIELFKEIKEKYPQTQFAYEADKYLAKMGVYN